MERRVFIAIVLSFLVLYFYQAYFAPPPPAVKPTASAPAQAPRGSTSPAASSAQPPSSPPSSPPASTGPQPKALVSEASEREITVDTNTVQAVLTNRGGRLLHWRLKNYRDAQGRLVDLVPSDLP